MAERMIEGAAPTRGPETVIVEEPMEIRLDDALVATTMRTPGHDFELAVGFCHSEGLLAGVTGTPVPVETVRYCATGTAVETRFNVVSVSTAGRALAPEPRLTTIGSSCGLCGSASIETLSTRLRPIERAVTPMRWDTLRVVGAAVRAGQELFESTGAVHAAAAFDVDSGAVLLSREDIGRHNAVDKVVGRVLLDGAIPARSLGLWISGRTSFEMVQKAWSAGFGVVASVSAPSSMAVETARLAGIALAGFVRDGRLTVYTEPDRDAAR